ncbi:hypothetical protein GCM10022245_21410 [Streptomyces mayteni]
MPADDVTPRIRTTGERFRRPREHALSVVWYTLAWSDDGGRTGDPGRGSPWTRGAVGVSGIPDRETGARRGQ